MIVVAGVAIGIGALVQGSVGFGMNVLAAPILAIIEPRFVPGPLLVAAATLTLLVALREHRAIRFGELGWAFLGRIPGSLAGTALVVALTFDQLAVMLALLVLAAVAISATGFHVGVSQRTLVGAGAVSGIMGTATSVGGPPMALLFQREAGDRVRGMLSGFFLGGTLISITLLTLAGRFGRPELELSLILVPGILLGFGVSTRARHLADRGATRPLVLGLSALSAVALLVRVATS